MHLIKENFDYLEKPILHMINQSIHQGVFPSQLKTSRVIPILKPGKPSGEMESYRPINLLPAFMQDNGESDISTIGRISGVKQNY